MLRLCQDDLRKSTGRGGSLLSRRARRLVRRRAARALPAAILGAKHHATLLLGRHGRCRLSRDVARLGVDLGIDNLGLDSPVGGKKRSD